MTSWLVCIPAWFLPIFLLLSLEQHKYKKTRVNGGARCIEGKESEITTAEVEVVRGINIYELRKVFQLANNNNNNNIEGMVFIHVQVISSW